MGTLTLEESHSLPASPRLGEALGAEYGFGLSTVTGCAFSYHVGVFYESTWMILWLQQGEDLDPVTGRPSHCCSFHITRAIGVGQEWMGQRGKPR